MQERLKERRKELGLTLEQVGDSVGVSKTTIRRWENGLTYSMGHDKVKLLAKALKVTPSFILGYDDSPFEDELVNWGIEIDDREIIAKVFKEYLPSHSPILAQITYESSKLDKLDQQLVLSIINSIAHNKRRNIDEND